MNGTCTPLSQKASGSAGHQYSFLKTWKASSQPTQKKTKWFCTMSSKTWSQWVTQLQQDYSQRKKSAPRTNVSASLSWPTPRTSDAKGGVPETELSATGFRSKRHRSDQWFGAKLLDAVESMENNLITNWATPTSRDWKGSVKPESLTRKDGKSRMDSLPNQAVYTPTSGHQDQTNPNTNGKNRVSLKLNPNWVEQLMGLPVGWPQIKTGQTG